MYSIMTISPNSQTAHRRSFYRWLESFPHRIIRWPSPMILYAGTGSFGNSFKSFHRVARKTYLKIACAGLSKTKLCSYCLNGVRMVSDVATTSCFSRKRVNLNIKSTRDSS